MVAASTVLVRLKLLPPDAPEEAPEAWLLSLGAAEGGPEQEVRKGDCTQIVKEFIAFDTLKNVGSTNKMLLRVHLKEHANKVLLHLDYTVLKTETRRDPNSAGDVLIPGRVSVTDRRCSSVRLDWQGSCSTGLFLSFCFRQGRLARTQIFLILRSDRISCR